jgi:hypothetical protein
MGKSHEGVESALLWSREGRTRVQIIAIHDKIIQLLKNITAMQASNSA